jgi:hypothetical protein
MYPVTHAAIAVGSVKAGERLFPTRCLPLDYRFAALGAILPDLIDKPLGWFLFPSLPDDHLWGHTAWFALLLISAGLVLAATKSDARVLLLGLGAATHLLVDPVNAHPRTLFWPLLGTTFPDVRGYLFVFPITLELVVVAALLIAARRSESIREHLRQFISTGAV